MFERTIEFEDVHTEEDFKRWWAEGMELGWRNIPGRHMDDMEILAWKPTPGAPPIAPTTPDPKPKPHRMSEDEAHDLGLDWQDPFMYPGEDYDGDNGYRYGGPLE